MQGYLLIFKQSYIILCITNWIISSSVTSSRNGASSDGAAGTIVAAPSNLSAPATSCHNEKCKYNPQ